METRTHSGLFNPGGCLSARAFRCYLDNTLRPSEKARVEDHLRHCLICSEALEGYKRHRNGTFMQSDLEFLTTRIKKRYAPKKAAGSRMPVTIVISLFVFLIILVIIYYMIRFLLVIPR